MVLIRLLSEVKVSQKWNRGESEGLTEVMNTECLLCFQVGFHNKT